jgi:hypothetical protein
VTIFSRHLILPPMQDRVFRTRVDAWLVMLVVGGAASPLLAAGWLRASGAQDGVALLVGWGVAMLVTTLVIGRPVRYEFQGQQLFIRSGWLRWRLDLAELRKARSQISFLTGPGWSVRRVRLEMSTGERILVSPDDRESFIQELASRCPHLVRAGSDLQPRPPSR